MRAFQVLSLLLATIVLSCVSKKSINIYHHYLFRLMSKQDTLPELQETSSDIPEESSKGNTAKVWLDWSTQSPKSLITPLSLIKEAEDLSQSTFLIPNLLDLTTCSEPSLDIPLTDKRPRSGKTLREPSLIDTISQPSRTDGCSPSKRSQEVTNMFLQTVS